VGKHVQNAGSVCGTRHVNSTHGKVKGGRGMCVGMGVREGWLVGMVKAWQPEG